MNLSPFAPSVKLGASESSPVVGLLKGEEVHLVLDQHEICSSSKPPGISPQAGVPF